MEHAPRAPQSLTEGRTFHKQTSNVCQVGEDVITNDETIQQHAIARTGIESNEFVVAHGRFVVPVEAPFDAPSIQPSNSKPNTPPSGNKPAMDGGENIEIPRAIDIDVTTAVVQHDQRHASPLEIQPPTTGREISQPCAEPSRTLNPGWIPDKIEAPLFLCDTLTFFLIFVGG